MSEGTNFIDRLIAAARRDPGAAALIHKRRGVWVTQRWGQVLEEIDRLAQGLRHLGLRDERQVAVDGEITAPLFLAAAAVRAAGGRILSIATAASAQELDRVRDDQSVDLVIGQGRDTVARWNEGNKRRVPIIFDHTTPDSRSPAEGIVTLATLRTLSEPAGWAKDLTAAPRSDSLPATWVEETTDWLDGLDILLDRWVASGEPLAFPELLAAATRDRLELSPPSWIASLARLDVNERAIRERLPQRNSIAAWLVDGALRGGTGPWFAVTRTLLCKRLGLHHLSGIDVHLGHEPGRAPALFRQLGLQANLIGHRAATEPVVISVEKPYRQKLVAAAAAR